MQDRIGTLIPQTDITIEARLGGGPGWETFQVRSSSIGRPFFAKFVQTYADVPWREEVHALGQLNHPNIVKLFRWLESEDEVIILFDWVSGETLEEVVTRRGPLPVSEVIAIGVQMARALYVVHCAGLVHRNVSPANIKLDVSSPDPFARLLDFKIVRPRHTEKSTEFRGDPRYAAPEELREGVAGPHTDVYQLACVLFYALTGAPPFDGASMMDVANAHVFLPPPRVSDQVSRLRRSNLDALLLRMLSKIPEARPSILEVVETLLDRHTELGAESTIDEPPPASDDLFALGNGLAWASATGPELHVVRPDGESSVNVGTRISSLWPTQSRVVFGSEDGKICVLDVESGNVRGLVEMARREAIKHVTETDRFVVAVDAGGRLIRADAAGQYKVFRGLFEPGQVRALCGARDIETVAALTGRRRVEIYSFLDTNSQAIAELDFDATFIAISPDGYVVAVSGTSQTVLLNALDGSVLHRTNVGSEAGTTFAKGHVFVARRRGGDTLFERVG